MSQRHIHLHVFDNPKQLVTDFAGLLVRGMQRRPDGCRSCCPCRSRRVMARGGVRPILVLPNVHVLELLARFPDVPSYL